MLKLNNRVVYSIAKILSQLPYNSEIDFLSITKYLELFVNKHKKLLRTSRNSQELVLEAISDLKELSTLRYSPKKTIIIYPEILIWLEGLELRDPSTYLEKLLLLEGKNLANSIKTP